MWLSSVAEALKQVIENGVIPVRLEEDVVRFRVGHLYSSPASGFRELYANELRACRTARSKYGANPRIEITVNVSDRILVIHGIDSLGITENSFVNTLSVLGETDNQDGAEVGQWGWGAAAACVSEDTECLTLDGWKKYCELKKGDIVATYNVQSKIVEYAPLKAIHTYRYDGVLYDVGGGKKHPSLLSTPDHRHVVSRLYLGRRHGISRSIRDHYPRIRKWAETIVTTQQLAREDKLRLIAPHEYPANAGVGSKELAALIGWVISEGWYKKRQGRGIAKPSHEVTMIRFCQRAASPYIDEIRRLLGATGADWREYTREAELPNHPKMKTFSLKGNVARKIREVCPDKRLNRFLAELPRDELHALFEALLKGDGTGRPGRGWTTFIQKDEQTTNWFQIIALRLNYYAIVTERSYHQVCGRPKEGKVFNVWLSHRQFASLYPGHGAPKKVRPVKYQGIVWCPQVENGTWVARRNGRPIITGNSTLSDSVKYETYARETGEKYAFLGIAGEHFSKLPQPDLDTPGTRVTVFLKDGVNISELIGRIQYICTIADIPTFLIRVNSSADEALLQDRSTPEQMNEPDITLHVPMAGTRVEVDDADFTLVGVFTPENSSSTSRSDGPRVDIRLLRMPIEADLKFPFDACILQIKDERKYCPTADRERLTDDAAERLSAKIREHLIRALPQALDINSFDDFRRKECKHIYFNLNPHFSSGLSQQKKQPLLEVYTPSVKTMELVHLLDIFVRVLYRRRRWYDNNKKVVDEERLGDVVAKSRNIFLVDSLDTQLQDTLQTRYPDAILITPTLPRSRHRYGESSFDYATIEKLEEQAIRTDAHAEAQNIKDTLVATHPAPRCHDPIDEERRPVIVHTSRIRWVEEHGTQHAKLADQAIEHMLPDVDKNTLFVPNIEKYLPVLQELKSRRGLARLDKLPKASQSRRLTLEQFLEKQTNHKVMTSQGVLTFRAIADSTSQISILVYDDHRIAGHYDGSEIFIPLSENDAFELAIYLRAKQRSYAIACVPSQEQFEKATQRSRWDYHYHDNNYESTANVIVNLTYHVGLVVKDEKVRQLFFAAATNASIPQLVELLNFCLDADEHLSKGGKTANES